MRRLPRSDRRSIRFGRPSPVALFILLVLTGYVLHGAGELAADTLQWSELPQLPDTIGYGGPYVGHDKGQLIVAGGANFPNGPPWGEQPGEKVWHDRIYVWSAAEQRWVTDQRLPKRMAYGATVPTPNHGLWLIGGEVDGVATRDVYILRMADGDSAASVEIETGPALPRACAYHAAVRVDQKIFVAAAHRTAQARSFDVKSFWVLDLQDIQAGWTALPTWPGRPRHKSAMAVQQRGEQACIYLIGGENQHFDEAGGVDLSQFESFGDGFRFDPSTEQWAPIAAYGTPGPAGTVPRAVVAASAVEVGQSHVLVFSGATGEHLSRPVQDRPRFHRDVMAYHTITDTWVKVGEMPLGVVTTGVTTWQGKIVIGSGEIKPGVRTPQVQVLEVKAQRSELGWLNLSVLAVYLLGLVAMGIYFSRREKRAEDFFLAGGRIPWWAAGLSIYATQLSAITFVSIPAVVYATDWRTFGGQCMILAMAPLVIWFYLPFYRRLRVTTAYEYLERRFNLSVRLYGSLSFIIFQLGRMAVVVYLPALGLAAVTGLEIYTCIITMGILATVYTVLGGMEAVIWTDVLQVIVLWGGMLSAIFLITQDLGGVAPILELATADQKLVGWDPTLDLTQMGTALILVGSFFLQFHPYTTDQAVVQRYLTTRDEQAAARGIWLNGALAIPFSFLFFALGTCLYVFFKSHPDLLLLGMENDKIFPWFIASEMPAGLSGLVIAGIFAASMSSLDSSMHSVATALTNDFYARLRDTHDHQRLNFARIVTLCLGLVGTGLAIVLASWDIRSLFFFFQSMLGLLSSGLVGIFILGMFTSRASAVGVLCGAVASVLLLYYITRFTQLNFYTYAPIGIVTSVVVGYAISCAWPDDPERHRGLTWKTIADVKSARDMSTVRPEPETPGL